MRCEPFAARGWDFDVCRVNCDEQGTVEALPIEFSASTPAGGTEAELVVCEKAADVAAEQIAGKIALFCGGLPEADVLLDSQSGARRVPCTEPPAYAAQHAGALSQTEFGIYFDGQGDFLGRNNVHVLGQEGLAHMVEQRCAAVAYPDLAHAGGCLIRC